MRSILKQMLLQAVTVALLENRIDYTKHAETFTTSGGSVPSGKIESRQVRRARERAERKKR